MDEAKSLWLDPISGEVCILDQRALPFQEKAESLKTAADVALAIREMHLRGAPLIGVAAAYGMYLACREAGGGREGTVPPPALLEAARSAAALLKSARPTAVNLAWAVDRMLEAITAGGAAGLEAVLAAARKIEDEEVEACRRIGEHGLPLIEEVHRRRRRPVRILTHCNAGWLACVRYGTATAPIYLAWEKGVPVHVWVDETRPLNQGARLTAWELGRVGVPHTVIPDNAGGHLMQQGRVDLVLVGSDRTTRRGDVANKIGTYLKALAAHDNRIPFYAALPTSTIDLSLRDGLKEIPIEERDPNEVHTVQGWGEAGMGRVRITPPESPAANPAFDVTPARLITALITEKGICAPNEKEIRRLLAR